jgi:hypothetical protein
VERADPGRPGEAREVRVTGVEVIHGLATARFDSSSGPPGLIIGYGNITPAAIERGVRELADLWHGGAHGPTASSSAWAAGWERRGRNDTERPAYREDVTEPSPWLE